MATAQASKKCRATAKGLFTKARNNLIKVIDNGSYTEIVESTMADRKQTYLSVQEKHAEYISILDIDENDQASWISSIDDEFDKSEEKKVFYVRKKIADKRNEDIKPKVGQSEDMQKQGLVMRKVEEAAFNSIHESLGNKILIQMDADGPMLDIVKEELSDLKKQLDACKLVHRKYIATLYEIPEQEIKWVSNLQEQVLEMNTKVSLLTANRESKKRSSIRLERIKMPKFDGNIRDYPRFKADFTRQVLPEFKNDLHMH